MGRVRPQILICTRNIRPPLHARHMDIKEDVDPEDIS